MPHYFYTDASGQKQGPIDDQTLRILASQKRILPSTPLETTGGHQGTAGQIPGLFKAAITVAARQLFCTNCGKPGPEQAPGCLACGMPPIGHNRFCRQCGTGFHPGQAVCTRCGTPLMSTPLPGPVPVQPSTTVESATDKVTGAILSIILLFLVIGAVGGLGWFLIYKLPDLMDGGTSDASRRTEIGNPFQKAKEGDWGKFSVKVKGGLKDGDRPNAVVRTKVVSIDGSEVKLRLSAPSDDGPLRALGSMGLKGKRVDEEDLDVSFNPKRSAVDFFLSEMKEDAADHGVKLVIKKGEASKETLEVDGKPIKCDVATFTVTLKDEDDEEVDKITIKEWTSSAIPGVPFVKVESTAKRDFDDDEDAIKSTIMLTDYGRDDD